MRADRGLAGAPLPARGRGHHPVPVPDLLAGHDRLQDADEIFAYPPVWWPASLQLGNFAVLFKDGDAWTVWNSLVIAAASTTAAMLLGTLCAYSIARFRTGEDNFAMWILSNRMVPPIVIVFPVFLLYVQIGWVDSFIGLIVLYTAFNLPYVIWMMRGYIQDVPLELEDRRWSTAAPAGACSGRWCCRWPAPASSPPPSSPSSSPGTSSCSRSSSPAATSTFPVQVTHYFGGQSNFWAKIAAMSVLGTVPIFVAVATLRSATSCAASPWAR